MMRSVTQARLWLLSLLALPLAFTTQSQNLPKSVRIDPATHIMYTGGEASGGLYDESVMRTFELWFAQPDYWQQLKNNYNAHIDIAATLIVDGDTFPNVGVRFKGQTSYSQTQTSDKKSFNITMDYQDPNQDLMGYQTINLNNCFEDASFMREVSYLHQIRNHVPAAKANYVNLYINGTYWGVYPNVQQLNGDYVKEWFFDNSGTLWRADRPSGSGGPGGGGPGWGDGTAALNYLGADTATYQQYYILKSTDQTNPWDDLVKTCEKLNTTPTASLEDTIVHYLDLDRTLWFLASEIAFSDDDSYVFKGKMDYYLYYEPETGFMTPLEFDGNSVMKSNATNWGVFYNETKVNYPLLNKLLAVPSIRQRYLAHMRTLAGEEMNSTTFNALVDQYDTMIRTGVQADTKKLYSFTEYTTQITSIKNFVSTHRGTLLGNAEMNATGPQISGVKSLNAAGVAWAEPVENEAFTVLATVTSANGIQSVTTYYSAALSGGFTKTPMFDDGAHNDGAAGDGIYGADIPGFPTGTYVRFYVEAKSANAAGTVTFDPVGAEHNVYIIRVSAPWAVERPIAINEIMASNQTGAQDENGDTDDWIELYNLTNQSVDLSGFFLSDNPSNVQKWSFPDGTVLPANGYLIVWADEDGSQGDLHANFKLSASGESLVLANDQARLVDTVNFHQQMADQAYARVPNGTGPFVLQAPTFGANNSAVATHEASASNDWRITPTLVSNAVQVDIRSESPTGTLDLMDMQGRIWLSRPLEARNTLNCSELPSGVYAIRLTREGISETRLIIKK